MPLSKGENLMTIMVRPSEQLEENMAVYIVCYDLMQQGQNYKCITDKLGAYPTHWHMQQSVWVIVTTESASQFRDNLRRCLDQNDKLMVAELSGTAAWSGYSEDITKWLKRQLA